VPQPPQFDRSLVRSRQTPEQFVRPVAQVSVHEPAEQIWPAAQTVPQPPQLSRSVMRLMQVPEQLT